MKHETRSILSFRRHLALWATQACSPAWLLVTFSGAALGAYMLSSADRSMFSLGVVNSVFFVVAQVGLWFAVGEREQRRLGGGKDSRK
jgi:hypothetical protein